MAPRMCLCDGCVVLGKVARYTRGGGKVWATSGKDLLWNCSYRKAYNSQEQISHWSEWVLLEVASPSAGSVPHDFSDSRRRRYKTRLPILCASGWSRSVDWIKCLSIVVIDGGGGVEVGRLWGRIVALDLSKVSCEDTNALDGFVVASKKGL